MQLDMATPALFFPAITLLFLAYTNKFLTLAGVIRKLHSESHSDPDRAVREQIDNLRYRLRLIQSMQGMGVLSFLLCVFTMFALFTGWHIAATWIFGASMIFLMASLALALLEIRVSVRAMDILLRDLDIRN